jgi:sugar phosphate isomerase/epimerase
MYSALSPGAIGVRAGTLIEAIAGARLAGFGGVEFSPAEVAESIEREGSARVRSLFDDAGVKPAGFGLPLDWRGDDAAWRSSLAALPRLAAVAQAIGCGRTMTWIMPCSNDRPYDANLQFHVDRFRPAAAILADHGCRLGLEFIGPKTLRESQRYPFIHTMDAMLEMGREIGPNVGLLLDCWHWHTSGGAVADLLRLTPADVVYVHVNDAPVGVAMDDYVDSVRGLPGETGVIDIAGFLQSLQAIGYNGPVAPEPFKKELAELPSDAARLQTVGESMRKIFEIAGIRLAGND